MKRIVIAAKQTLMLWVSLLLLSGLTFLLASQPAMREWLWQQTGEEAFAAQLKGLSDLAADQLRPRLQLAADAAMQHRPDNPYGVNVFLEQEAEPAKRALAVEMAAAAGFHWLRFWMMEAGSIYYRMDDLTRSSAQQTSFTCTKLLVGQSTG